MIPRAGELVLICLAVFFAVTFHRLPAVGDALGRWLGVTNKPKVPPPPSS